jgi:hypothetical protein
MNDKEKLEKILEFLEKKKENSKLDDLSYESDDYSYFEGIKDSTDNIYHNIKEIIDEEE